MKVYTKKGDSGTTGLYYGQRVSKDSDRINANGAVDEAQAALGLARAEAERDSELNRMLILIEKDLWVLMAEVGTDDSNRPKLKHNQSLVTQEMILKLEEIIDDLSLRFELPTEFVVPGQNKIAATLDVARTVIRRAERCCIGVLPNDSLVIPYLNRLSDLVWTMARWQEGEHVLSKDIN